MCWQFVEPCEASRETLLDVHTPKYLDWLHGSKCKVATVRALDVANASHWSTTQEGPDYQVVNVYISLTHSLSAQWCCTSDAAKTYSSVSCRCWRCSRSLCCQTG